MNARVAEKVVRCGLDLLPVISFIELDAFESAAGIRIPEDYRSFLFEIGNGGHKRCQMLPLSRWNDCYWSGIEDRRVVAEPCIITPDLEEYGEHWLDRANIPDWSARWDRGEWDPMFGTIAVAEFGCGLCFSMIVNGPFRGRIFSWGDHAKAPPYMFPQANFSDWLESCLDDLLLNKSDHFLKRSER